MLIPLQATETHCDTVELGSADARFSERVLCLNSNVEALHTVLLVLSPLAAMTQSGMVCLQAATVLLMAQALIRASPLAEKFLRQSLPDEPASGTSPSCLEVALKESFDNNPPDPKFLVQLLAPVSHTHREGVIVAFLTALTQPALQARLGIVGVSMDIIDGLEYVANGVTVPAGQIS